jgi:hypothetical protein
MADATYKEHVLLFHSQGIVARVVDDAAESPSQYQNLDNLEELAEGSFSPRLGSEVINICSIGPVGLTPEDVGSGDLGDSVCPLTGVVNSLGRLDGLNGDSFRYAGTNAGLLYRVEGLSPGSYTQISNAVSGNPMWFVATAPTSVISTPTMFIADAVAMMKDNGTFATPQQMGIFQPQFPVLAQAQQPSLVVLDNYVTTSGSYFTTGSVTVSNSSYVNTTLTVGVVATGVQEVSYLVGAAVLANNAIGLFQLLTIDTGANAEVVLVIFVTDTGFVANFTKLHSFGVSVVSASLTLVLPASATGTVNIPFSHLPAGLLPIPANWPVSNQALQQADYIGLYVNVSDPTQVQSIQIAFDCGDGSFTGDYFYKTIAQGPLQSLLSTASTNSTAATTAATDALLDQSLGLYGNNEGSIAQLNTGNNNWTPLLLQLSDFAGAGRADFSDPVYNWPNVNGYQVTVVMNDTSSATVQFSALILFGGAGPDSFAGVGYDYLYTFFNINDWTESNPSMSPTNVNPPNNTNWVVPRRQPVLLTMNHYKPAPLGGFEANLDPQTTHIRIYRRGGTLGDNYRRVDQIPVTGLVTTYTDTTSDQDLEGSDFVSFVNDVPVTSSLQTPVNTTLSTALIDNQFQTILPVSMDNISRNQQVSIGTPTALGNNYETVIVISINLNPVTPHQPISFTAYVQNAHAIGELVSATAVYGQAVTIMAWAFNQMWYMGDPNNPSYLYWSAKNNPQYVSSAAYIDIGSPDDPGTAIVPYKGNLYVSSPKTGFQSVAPGSNQNGSPTLYPTACKHGIVATFGWFATEQAIFYQAIDGLRAFAGGPSEYLTQDQEFIFQGIGDTPIVQADPTQLSSTVAAYWNMMGFFSYVGLDGNRHSLIMHQVYKRWRNDDADRQSILLEVPSNQLVYGDSQGLVHIDRQDLAYDEGASAGVLVQVPIAVNLQTFYQNQGMPANQKNYNEFQIDTMTAGQTLTVTLLFNDGQQSLVLGTVNTTERQKFNFQINGGNGFQAYKVALQITGSVTQRFYIYQAAIKAIALPITRRSVDTYDLNCGGLDSKICRDCFFAYSATAPIVFNVYYDSSPTSGYTFTLPVANGLRNPQRVRLPGVSFRTIRIIGASTGDFMLWEDCALWIKFLCSSRGYEKALLLPNQ